MNPQRKPISVCMAVYNGEKFISEQLDSILKQLDNELDEVIIIDDCSKDRSYNIIKNYNNLKIKLYKNNTNLGYIKTFEKALKLTNNDVIFLSDQDDIWIEGRLLKMYNNLVSSDALIVCSNFQAFNNKNEAVVRFKTRLKQADSNKNFQNILGVFKGQMAYFGCTMAFRKDFLKIVMPFPDYIEAHDLWFAICGNIAHKIVHLEENTLLHRIHGENTSFVKRKLYRKLYTRYLFFRSLFESKKRIKRL